MKTPEIKRNLALMRARHYARSFQMERLKMWLDIAKSHAPLTKIQEWKIKSIIGEEKFKLI